MYFREPLVLNMLGGAGVRTVLDSVTFSLVLMLGSFAPSDKPVLMRCGRHCSSGDTSPSSSISTGRRRVTTPRRLWCSPGCRARRHRLHLGQGGALGGPADSTVLPARARNTDRTHRRATADHDGQRLRRRRVACTGAHDDVDDLVARLQEEVIATAEARAERIAADIARAKALLRAGSGPSGSIGVRSAASRGVSP